MKYAAAIVIVLVAGFAITPTTPVSKKIGVAGKVDFSDPYRADTRPDKSGLRLAIEGRLAWLGVL